MAHILIVEDEEKLAKIMADYLQQAGYQTSILLDGLDVINTIKTRSIDLVLLDLMLPGQDGLTLCRELREFSDIAIIMLTARVEEIDRLLGLGIGADDYICKPYSPREVVARVKTILRRISPPASSSSRILTLDDDTYQVKVNQQVIELTAIEFNLLKILNKKPGRIYSRAQLIEMVYQDNRIVSERTIDSHIKKLRKKLNTLETDNELVQSVYSVGYKLILS
ncbi:response regulator [uncultured Paraglaciecola sp.]|jgi:two-component system response regulator BaeR|uniref:response regulator n=1 Tax=uncultured Paraglaciecola sp. TaxID=1765024 RepID=UPI0025FD7B55|nr:response regulator [uncultured Paraglaciecola sp.]